MVNHTQRSSVLSQVLEQALFAASVNIRSPNYSVQSSLRLALGDLV